MKRFFVRGGIFLTAILLMIEAGIMIGGCGGGIFGGKSCRCNDGTSSNACGKQGACSHHGGVARAADVPEKLRATQEAVLRELEAQGISPENG